MRINFVNARQLRAKCSLSPVWELNDRARRGPCNWSSGGKRTVVAPMIDARAYIEKKARAQRHKIFEISTKGLFTATCAHKRVSPAVYKYDLITCATNGAGLKSCDQSLSVPTRTRPLA